MKYDLIRAAMEAVDDADPVRIPTTASTNNAVIPAIDPNSNVLSPSKDISPDEKSQLLLFMLKKYFGTERFVELIKNIAMDMEVYGLINNAANVKSSALSIGKDADQDRWSKPIMMAALKMAVRDNTDAARRYADAEKAENEALDDIMREYGTDAKRALVDMLQNDLRKCMMMNGQDAKAIQAAIADIADHLE